jgi:hypothetical protein
LCLNAGPTLSPRQGIPITVNSTVLISWRLRHDPSKKAQALWTQNSSRKNAQLIPHAIPRIGKATLNFALKWALFGRLPGRYRGLG